MTPGVVSWQGIGMPVTMTQHSQALVGPDGGVVHAAGHIMLQDVGGLSSQSHQGAGITNCRCSTPCQKDHAVQPSCVAAAHIGLPSLCTAELASASHKQCMKLVRQEIPLVMILTPDMAGLQSVSTSQ